MLSLSSENYFLEDADSHIQANLEDSVVKEALKSGVDLREYSAQVVHNVNCQRAGIHQTSYDSIMCKGRYVTICRWGLPILIMVLWILSQFFTFFRSVYSQILLSTFASGCLPHWFLSKLNWCIKGTPAFRIIVILSLKFFLILPQGPVS